MSRAAKNDIIREAERRLYILLFTMARMIYYLHSWSGTKDARIGEHPPGRLGADLATDGRLSRTLPSLISFLETIPLHSSRNIRGPGPRRLAGNGFLCLESWDMSPCKAQAMRPTWKEGFLRAPNG